MASKYMPKKEQAGGVGFREWVLGNLHPSLTVGQWIVRSTQTADGKIQVRGADGHPKIVSTFEAGIHFGGPWTKPFTPGPKGAGGGAGAAGPAGQVTRASDTVLGQARLALVEFGAAEAACFGYAGCPEYYGVATTDVVIPLGIPQSALAKNVVGNIASAWVTAYKFGIECNQQCNLYLSAIHSVLVQLLNDKLCQEEYDGLVRIAILLIAVTKDFFLAFPEHAGPLDALCQDVKAVDMTQRCLALLLPKLGDRDSVEAKGGGNGGGANGVKPWAAMNAREMTESWLEMLSTALGRWRTRLPKDAQNSFLSSPPRGVFNCMIVIPTICEYALADDSKRVHDPKGCSEAIKTRLTNITEGIDPVKQKPLEIEQVVMQRILGATRLPMKHGRSGTILIDVSQDIAHAFYRQSVSGNKRPGSEMNYVELKILPPVKLPFELVADETLLLRGKPLVRPRLSIPDAAAAAAVGEGEPEPAPPGKIDDKESQPGAASAAASSPMDWTPGAASAAAAAASSPSDMDWTSTAAAVAGDQKSSKSSPSLANSAIVVRTSNPTEWSAVQLPVKGWYTLETSLCGGATYGVGNTSQQTNVANVRFTVGQDVMPPGIPGYSSAGKRFDPTKRNDRGGSKGFITAMPIDLKRTLLIEITDQKFALQYADRRSDGAGGSGVIYTQSTQGLSFLIGFQYCHLLVTRLPGEPKVKMNPLASMMQSLAIAKPNL